MILWKNAIIHTLEDEFITHHQMATDQGLIIGFDDEIKNLKFDQEIDLNQNHVYPGFVDSHMHLLGYGKKLSIPTLENVFNKNEILKEIKKHVDLKAYYFEGYHPTSITKEDLNLIKHDGPLILRHSDYHSVTVNDYVLKVFDIESDTGFVTEEYSDLIIKKYSSYKKEELIKLLNNSIKSLYRYGITGGHSDDLSYYNSFSETLDVFKTVLKDVPFRAHLLMHYKIIDEYLNSNLNFLDQTDFLQLGAVKIFYDGTFTSRTALLHHPYQDESNQGMRMFSSKELLDLIKHLRAHDLPLAIHVIGDLGLNEVVKLLKTYPPKKGLHDRIIHASLADMKTMLMMKDMPIILDVQPQFITSDIPGYLSIFSQKPEFIYPFNSYMKNGITLCGSSDAPIEIPNPLLGMHVSIFRRLKDGSIFDPSEKISRFEALNLYTSYANIPTYKQNRGFIKKGYIADFSILAKDILTMNEASFFEDLIKMTVIDEKIVYQNH